MKVDTSMAKLSDVALIGGLGILAFLVIRGGRDLFGAISGIKLPSIGDITFPDINLPAINIPNPFASTTVTERDILEQSGATPTQQAIAIANDANLNQGVEIPPDIQRQIDLDFQNDPNRDTNRFNPPGSPEGAGFTTIPGIDRGFISAEAAFPNTGGEVISRSEVDGLQIEEEMQMQQNPISNLSLGDIIDRFGVSASQAANIRAVAANDFGDFNFGTNTGSGIGSVIQENPLINTALPNFGEISNPEFEGLSAQEIALQLTGGNLSNF